jgi:TonB family protein
MSGQELPGDSSTREANTVAATWDRAAGQYLVSCAARKAPPGLAARLEEEWLADLMARRGAFARIRFGLGCCWATRVIAREFGSAAVAAGGSASGQRLLVAFGGYDFSRLSRRTIALIVIACLHVAVFYVYLTDFTRPAASISRPDIQADFLNHYRHPERPAHLPLPSLSAPTTVSLPKPNIPLNFPADPKTITVAHSFVPGPAPAPLSAPEPVRLMLGGPGAGFPTTEGYYPAVARRLGDTGTAAVRVCVDPRGRLTSVPTIFRSSGIAQLDQGALRLARAGSGHYRPSTENGRPVTACYAFRIKFQLEDADQ